MNHKDNDRAYIIATENIATGDRNDYEFASYDEALAFGDALSDGIDWELRRCHWWQGRWYQEFRAPEVMADFDRKMAEGKAIAP